MKEVKEVLHKFYISIDDARADVKYFFVTVECEGSVQPNSASAFVDVSTNEIFDFDKPEVDYLRLEKGIFTLKTMKRETLFGTILEKVYIFHNYEGKNGH